MKEHCIRCNALIELYHIGGIYDGSVHEELWSRDCPFCNKSNLVFK